MDAYKIFETMNDRGLETTQVDILKNYLFQEAGPNKSEAQPKWTSMRTAIGVVGDEYALPFLKHFVITKHGPTREPEIFEKIERTVSGKHQALEFLDELEQNADDYAAILLPDHNKWISYGPQMRKHIRTMLELKVAQIRPLMLSVAEKLLAEETEKAFSMFVNWTVRFLIAGGGRGGSLEEAYALRAKEIVDGKISAAKDLLAAMKQYIPNDTTFQEAFSVARVSREYLARYYLRAMENQKRGVPEPEFCRKRRLPCNQLGTCNTDKPGRELARDRSRDRSNLF